jgi:hypothetical protein
LKRVFSSYSHRDPDGRADVDSWIDRAVRTRLLDLSELRHDEEVLTTIVLSCPDGSPYRARASEFLANLLRTQPIHDLGLELVTAQPPDLEDLLLCAARDQRDIRRAALHRAALRVVFAPRVARFVARYYLLGFDEPVPSFPEFLAFGTMRTFAEQLVSETYMRWRDPVDEEFQCELFRRVFNALRADAPRALPAPGPLWLRAADVAERTFLERSLALPARERLALLAMVYAELDVPQLSAVVPPLQPDDTERVVRDLLIEAWNKIFDSW